jgi:hypothetical protein
VAHALPQYKTVQWRFPPKIVEIKSFIFNHYLLFHNMKNWQKIVGLALVAAVFILESCHRGYGCPGADL